MRIAAAILLALATPLVAVAGPAQHATVQGTAEPIAKVASRSTWTLPLWRTPDGRLAIVTGAETNMAAVPQPFASPLAPGGAWQVTDVRWPLKTHAYTRVGVTRLGNAVTPCAEGDALCAAAQDRWSGARFGGGYHFPGFTLDVGASWMDHAGARRGLPTVLPEATGVLGGVLGVGAPFANSFGRIGATGSVPVGNHGYVDVGASVGRVSMLPGNLTGLEAIDQRALSFGVGTGIISGAVTGRVMEPVGGFNLPGVGQRWSAIDLGVTVRLPWEGELSVGTQNLWSSNHAQLPAAPTEPTQSRVPYIQYHQEL